jgi:DNA-binding CsgD family transcriptional regulator
VLQVQLTSDADAAYRAMLAEPTWGVADLAAHLGMSPRRIRKALDVLADLALLQRTSDGELQPISPDAGFATLLADAEREIQERQNQIEAARSAVAAIAAEHESRRGSTENLRLDGVEAVRTRLVELSRRSRLECLSFSPNGAHRPDAMSASRPLNEAALARGVQMRCVYQDAYRNDPDTVAYAEWLTRLGGNVRTVPSVPMQLVVVDREVAILPTNPADSRVGAIEVRNLGMLAVVCALFETVWSSATPLGASASVDSEGLSAIEREVLKFLSEGHTDDSLARRLGVSVRTVRRTVADLTERLGATSRFQAGVKAAQRGWL